MAIRGSDAFDVMNNSVGNGQKSQAQQHQDYLKSMYDALGKRLGTSFANVAMADFKKQQKEKDEQEKRLVREGLELKAKYDAKFTDRFSASMRLWGDDFTSGLKKSWDGIISKLENSFATFSSAINTSVEAYTQIYQKYQASMNARLQGSMYDFQGLTTTIQGNLAVSPYVKQTAVLENLSKLVESGTSFNIEQRAFLATISDKIATTFDSFDSSLMNIIRIQQADSTVARLGMEAQLTQYLNSRYSDTSYLNDSYKIVRGNLFGATSTMSREQAVEFEYQVQKWLGSLQSVGVGSGTISNLAQMLGALGSGDVSALAGNQSLQNLLAISSNCSFGGLLTGGLNAKNTNQLLYNLVNYLGGIQGNNVVKTQLAQIFGMSRSDIEAISNLSSSDLQNILGTNLTYSGAVAETNSQLGKVASRMHVSELISNVFSNLTASLGGAVANSPGAYAAWMATSLLEGATGGTNIPAVFGMGTGVDLNATVEQLMKLGIMAGAGIGTGMVGKALSSLSNGGSLNLANWNAQDTISRGGGFTGVREGVSVDVSSTQYIGSSSSSDIYEQTVTAAKESTAEEVRSSVEKEDVMQDNVQRIRDLLDALVEGTETLKVRNVSYARSAIDAIAGGGD